MPVQPTYPGVYIDEVASGVRTITGVATSITAFLGRARHGPVNDPVTINGFADFERVFGGLWAESTLGYAMRDFFRNGGGQAIVVRLYHPFFVNDSERTAALAAAEEVADAADTEATKAPTLMPTPASVAAAADDEAKKHTTGVDQVAAQAVVNAAKVEAAKAGATAQSVADAAAGVASATTAGLAAAQAVAAAADTEAKRTPVPTPKSVADAADDEAKNHTSGAAQVAAQEVANAAKAAAEKTAATSQSVSKAAAAAVASAAPVTNAGLSVGGLDLQAASPGSWGNQLEATVDHDVADGPTSDLFNLTISLKDTGESELFRNVSVDSSHPRRIDKVLAAESRLARALSLPTAKPGTATATVGSEVASDGEPPDTVDVKGSQSDKEGLYALEKADLFNLLCIPPYSPSGDVDSSVIGDAAEYCEKRRAMLIIDPPSTWKTKDAAKAGVSSIGTTRKNAALFFPRLVQPNPLRDNQLEEFAPCGAVAGVFARTDAQRGVWKAPAGLDATLVGVPALSVPLTDPENGELNPLGVNCLRVLVPAGPVIWGARTCQGNDRFASEWKYIPVRRLALNIEETLYRGTQWVVFEPNDEPLWGQIRMNVGAFMHGLFRQGAFQGRSPREAYFVKCDKETTTQADINLGIVNILVGFAPLKPAEFVIIKIQQMAGQIET